MNERLMGIVVGIVYFLANCDDETLDPDVAVKILEDIASEMNELSPEEKETFVSYSRKLADETRNEEEAEFYRNMPESLGLQS